MLSDLVTITDQGIEPFYQLVKKIDFISSFSVYRGKT